MDELNLDNPNIPIIGSKSYSYFISFVCIAEGEYDITERTADGELETVTKTGSRQSFGNAFATIPEPLNHPQTVINLSKMLEQQLGCENLVIINFVPVEPPR